MRSSMVLAIILSLSCTQSDVRKSNDNEPAGASQAPTKEENLATAAHGSPVVAAIYRYKHANGLWPADLREVFADFIKEDQCRGWTYKSWYDGGWTLTNYAGFPHTAVRYNHPKNDLAHWEVSWGEDQAPIDFKQELPNLAPADTAKTNKAFQEIMARKIKEYPKQAIHQKGFVSILYRKGLYKESREACQKCLDSWPDMWWPNLMQALIDVQIGKSQEAEKRLLPWVEKHNDFNHWFFAAYFYDSAGEKQKCASSLEKAASSKLDTTWVEWKETGENFGSLSCTVCAWHSAMLAYRYERIDLCLAICDVYDVYRKQNNENPFLHAFRAACLLKRGKIPEAKAVVEEIYKYRNVPRCERVDELRRAIDAKDTTYRYDPRNSEDEDLPNTWKILIRYE